MYFFALKADSTTPRMGPLRLTPPDEGHLFLLESEAALRQRPATAGVRGGEPARTS